MKLQCLNGESAEYASACAGIVPSWIQYYEDTADMSELIDGVIGEYGYPVSEMKDGTLYSDGSYDYPGDPEMLPNMVMHITAGRIYSYDYGMFAFFDNHGGSKMYRLD